MKLLSVHLPHGVAVTSAAFFSFLTTFLFVMTLKQKLLAGYFGIGFLFLLYFWIFGSTGFGYALGKGLVWPAVLFPGFGAFLGGVILLAFLAFVMIS